MTHPAWCARGHRCGLGEHRADPVVLAFSGLGRITITRVQASTGRSHAEIRATVALTTTETVARKQLLAILAELPALLTLTVH